MRANLKTLALLGVLGLAAAAFAQADPSQGRDSVEQRINRMREGLGLSDEQAVRIEAILREVAGKREAIEKRGAGRTPEGLALRREVRRQIEAVLTPEQREKRDAIAAKRKSKGPAPAQGRRRLASMAA